MSQYQKIYKDRFDKVVDQINAKGLLSKIHPQEGKIRIEQPIIGGKTQYVFDLKTPDVDNISTFALRRNDVFVPFAISVMVGFRHKVTKQTKLFTFLPLNDGVAPSAYPKVGFANDHLAAMYNGALQWVIGTEELYSAYPMENFLKVPETQPCFVLDSNDGAVQQSIELERSMEEYLQIIYPKVTLAGTRDHKVTVNFEAGGLTDQAQLAGTDAANYEAIMCLYMDGIRVVSGCENGNDSAFGAAIGNW